MASLEGKIALVTGGARGIGAGIVLALAEKGAKIAFNYVSDSSRQAAEELCQKVSKLGSKAVGIQVDVVALDGPERLISAAVESFQSQKLDILVNNAGVAGNTLLAELTRDEYDHIMNVNVKAVVFMTQAFLPKVNPGGRIVNVSSISARAGYPTQTSYAASKAALEGLTRVWATELGQKYKITVNAVNPGPVDTDMYRAAGEVHLARMAEENKRVPAEGRAGTAADIGDIICFLCEERSRWVTGDVICANGGMIYT